MEFASPKILWLLVLLVPLVAYYVWRTMVGGATIRMSSVEPLRRAPRTVRYYLRHLPIVLRVAAFVLIVIALARPQEKEYNAHVEVEGVDIAMAMDVSTSMLAEDFTPNRLEAAKEVAASFINERRDDRIALVVFAGESYWLSPLAYNKAHLQTMVGNIRCGEIDDGTAIGNGLVTAINRLRDSEATSKVVVLLTDGMNNRGHITPLDAADMAANMGIKVYTIGVGCNGSAPTPVYDEYGRYMGKVMAKVEIDETMLHDIAERTGGRYFRAMDNETLREVYNRIDELEKSRMDSYTTTRVHEKFFFYVVAAFVLLLLEVLFNSLILKRIP